MGFSFIRVIVSIADQFATKINRNHKIISRMLFRNFKILTRLVAFGPIVSSIWACYSPGSQSPNLARNREHTTTVLPPQSRGRGSQEAGEAALLELEATLSSQAKAPALAAAPSSPIDACFLCLVWHGSTSPMKPFLGASAL